MLSQVYHNGQSPQKKENLMFGRVERFKSENKEAPGPGAYNDLNKWHKKTYNLKFLNVSVGQVVEE
jgi:hypothetical protein